MPLHPVVVLRRVRRALTALVVAAVVLLARVLLSAHYAEQQLETERQLQSAVTVRTTRPQPSLEGVQLVLPGNLQANFEATIHARISGYLRRWLVDIGTPVKAGQVLAEIEAPEIDQQLRQTEADLATAQANQQIAAITADRWRNLRTTDSVSKQEAEEKISLAVSGDARVEAARANVQRMRELSRFEKIIAPFSGIVTARNTDVGELINAGNSSGHELFRIADTHQLRLYVRVPQVYAASMHPGLKAVLQVTDHPQRRLTAMLDRTAQSIDSGSRTLLVQLIVDNSNNELLPGAYAEVRFDLTADDGRLNYRIPANALLSRDGGLSVAMVDARTRAVMKPVTIGRDYGSEVEIVRGLDPQDDIILNPPDSLTDGAILRVVGVQ